MNTARRRRTEGEYRQAFDKLGPGADLGVIARRLGVKRSTVLWWKSELKRRDREQQTFLPVKVVGPGRGQASRQQIEITHPSGAVIRVPSGFEIEDLARVVRALELARC